MRFDVIPRNVLSSIRKFLDVREKIGTSLRTLHSFSQPAFLPSLRSPLLLFLTLHHLSHALPHFLTSLPLSLSHFSLLFLLFSSLPHAVYTTFFTPSRSLRLETLMLFLFPFQHSLHFFLAHTLADGSSHVTFLPSLHLSDNVDLIHSFPTLYNKGNLQNHTPKATKVQ